MIKKIIKEVTENDYEHLTSLKSIITETAKRLNTQLERVENHG